MEPTDGTEIRKLADHLARLLPHAMREVTTAATGEAVAAPLHGTTGGRNGGTTSGNGNGATATLASWGLSVFADHDVDADRALGLQLDAFLSAHPDLGHKVREVQQRHGNRQARQALHEHLREVLGSTDERTREMLWALLVGPKKRGATRRRPRGGRLSRLLHSTTTDGRVARSTAAAWMTLLIALPVLVAFLTIWGGLAKSTRPDELSVGALKVFATWCLAFLPGWLYVRFLGQRAGALWSEYVLNLHRLGWDRPDNLPRPPRNSEFHQEWLTAKGYLQSQEHNIYRQKFNAYYGRSVSDSGTSSNFSVRSETMFPVFLATAVLAACWVAVLWDTTTVSDPSSVWDILKFAYLGAYAFIVQSLIRRFFQSDLRPSAYAAAVLRVIVVLVTMVALHQLLDPVTSVGTEAAVAFVVGFFPVIALQALQRAAAATLRVFVPQLTPEYPLNQLDGLNVWYESRLVEEGIEDMENLATANLVDVVLHTRVPVGRLVDWVDQAQLYLHLDRAERGHRERQLVKASEKPGVHDGTKPSGEQATPEEFDIRAFDPLVHGSLSPHNRAGTKTRVALRQLGIRTATDLLKAFPPDEIDRRSEADGGASQARFERLMPKGIEADQIRMLVRVLDEEPALAPIWNWQTRGVRARRDCRRPRSERPRRRASTEA